MRAWYPVLLLVAAPGGGAVLGALLIRWRSTSNDLSRNFVGTNQFDEFSALVSGLFGVSVAVAFFTWPTFWRIKAQVTRSPLMAAIMFYLIVSAAVIVGPLVVETGKAIVPLSHFTLRIIILYIFVLACGGGSFCGLVALASIYSAREDWSS